MTRDERAQKLAAIQQARDERVEIWIEIIEADGTPSGQRIYRGSFQRPRDPKKPQPGD